MQGSIEHLLITQSVSFTLVLARVSGLVMTAPIFGGREIPMQVRVLLAVMLTLLIMPLQFATATAWRHRCPTICWTWPGSC